MTSVTKTTCDLCQREKPKEEDDWQHYTGEFQSVLETEDVCSDCFDALKEFWAQLRLSRKEAYLLARQQRRF